MTVDSSLCRPLGTHTEVNTLAAGENRLLIGSRLCVKD